MNSEEHYHCSICGSYHNIKSEADKCFMNHSEIDTLRYIMFEIYHHLNKSETNLSSEKYINNAQKYFDKGMDDKGYMRNLIASAYKRFGIEEPEVYLNRDKISY